MRWFSDVVAGLAVLGIAVSVVRRQPQDKESAHRHPR